MKPLTNLTAFIMLALVLPGCGSGKSGDSANSDPTFGLKRFRTRKPSTGHANKTSSQTRP